MWLKGDLFAFIVDSLSDFVSLINTDYIYEIVNQSYCEYRGMEKSDIIGKKIADIWGQERFEAEIEPVIKRVFAGEIVNHQLWENFENFGDIYLDITVYPYSMESAETITHILVIMKDITEKKIKDQEFRETRSNFERELRISNLELTRMNENLKQEIARRTLIEEEIKSAHVQINQLITSIKTIIMTLDNDSVVRLFNPTAEEAFGLHADDVIGKKVFDCGFTWNGDEIAGAIERCISKNAPVHIYKTSFTRTDGSGGLLALDINPIFGEKGRHLGLIIWGSDVTERVRLEVQLDQAQRLESIGQLSAGIAHEINTPTQYVGDNIIFLKEAFDDLIILIKLYRTSAAKFCSDRTLHDSIEKEEKRIDLDYLMEEIPKAIAQSTDGVKRVSEIVKSMKDFSYPEGEDKVLLDINGAINSTVTITRNEWKYVAEMETKFNPEIPLVLCFPGMFNQVILNLIVNAAHAIGDVVKNSGNKGKITISTDDEDDTVVVRVSDTGSGIPENIRHKIFDPFFTTKEVGKGTGQGLAIAHTVIVEKHGGSITFDSELGKGTTFIIRIPVGKPEDTEVSV